MFFVVFSFDLPRSTGILLIRRSLRWNVSREWKRRMGRKSRVEGGKADWKTGTKNLFSLFFIFSFAMGSRCFGSRWHRTSPRSTGRRWTLRVLLSTSFTTLKPNSLVSGFFFNILRDEVALSRAECAHLDAIALGRRSFVTADAQIQWGSDLFVVSVPSRVFLCLCLCVKPSKNPLPPLQNPFPPMKTRSNPFKPVFNRWKVCRYPFDCV